MKKYIAEIIGTFTLTAVVLGSLSSIFPISTVLLAGITLGLFVYSIGHISGSHINPAVTLGLLSIKKISLFDAVLYIIAQCVGAGLAYLAMHTAFGTEIAHVVPVDSIRVVCAEILGTFLFTFGIASVVYGQSEKSMGGIVVGGSLALGITLASFIGSNGVLNPAVALGIGSFNLSYLLAPIVGSVLGMNVYKLIK
jgi:aquaporin Z